MNDHVSPTPLEDRLRATLAAAAPADTGVEAGLDDLRSRLDGVTVVPLRRSAPPARGPRRRMQLTAAAVVMALAAIGAGLVLGSGGGSEERVDADRPATTRSVSDTPPVRPEDAAWYLPVDLPPGWTLSGISVDYRDVEGSGACPCRTTAWTSPDKTLVTMVGTSTANATFAGLEDLAGELEPVALGGGIEGRIGQVRIPGAEEGTGAWVVGWIEDGAGRSINLAGQSKDAAVAVAKRLAVDLDGPPADGWTVLSDVTRPGGVGSFDTVDIGFITPSGARVGYQLAPSGFGDLPFGYVTPQRHQPEGQGQPLLRFDFPARSFEEQDLDTPAVTVLAGTWVGADVVLGASNQEASDVQTDSPAFDEMLTLAASLQPASAEEWAAFLDTLPGGQASLGERVPRTGAVADLVRRPGEDLGD